MKIYKTEYGWSTTAHTDTIDGQKRKCYMSVGFKKGTEPVTEVLEGDLIFKDIYGRERNCFFTNYEKNGTPIPKLMVMGETRSASLKADRTFKREDIPTSIDNPVQEEDLPW